MATIPWWASQIKAEIDAGFPRVVMRRGRPSDHGPERKDVAVGVIHEGHHHAWVYEGATRVRYYIDGEEQ